MIPIETYERLVAEVRAVLEDLADGIDQAIADMIALIGTTAEKFDSVRGAILGPLGSVLIDGVSKEDVNRAREVMLRGIAPQLTSKAGEAITLVGDLLDSLDGDPAELQRLSHAYAECRTHLLKPAPSIWEETTALGRYWEGPAYESYAVAARVQVRAVEATAASLDMAATLTNHAARALVDLWTELVNDAAQTVAATLRVIGDVASIEKILSFNIPTALNAIAEVVVITAEIRKQLDLYMSGRDLTDQLVWRQLNNGPAEMPGNAWPRPADGSIDALADSDAWIVEVDV